MIVYNKRIYDSNEQIQKVKMQKKVEKNIFSDKNVHKNIVIIW